MSVRLCVHGRVFIVEQFLSKSLWMVAGRTAAWPDEQNPPVPTGTEESVTTPQFAKKINTVYAVYPGTISSYDIKLDNAYWKICGASPDNYTNYGKYLYMRFVIERNTGPDVTVRQFGVVNGLVPTAGNETKDILLPAEINNYGKLIYLENRVSVDRSPNDQGEMFEYIMAF
jgi:hypothetical protein